VLQVRRGRTHLARVPPGRRTVRRSRRRRRLLPSQYNIPSRSHLSDATDSRSIYFACYSAVSPGTLPERAPRPEATREATSREARTATEPPPRRATTAEARATSPPPAPRPSREEEEEDSREEPPDPATDAERSATSRETAPPPRRRRATRAELTTVSHPPLSFHLSSIRV
jgi:hypothetical protein